MKKNLQENLKTLQDKSKKISSTKKNSRSNQAKTNKTNGHNFERDVVNILKQKHTIFDKAKTSREASRLLDNCKVDIWGIPFMAQLKHGRQQGLKPNEVLDEMEKLLNDNFPKGSKELEALKVVIRKFPVGKGKKYNKNNTLVYLNLDDFLNLYIKAYENNSD